MEVGLDIRMNSKLLHMLSCSIMAEAKKQVNLLLCWENYMNKMVSMKD